MPRPSRQIRAAAAAPCLLALLAGPFGCTLPEPVEPAV